MFYLSYYRKRLLKSGDITSPLHCATPSCRTRRSVSLPLTNTSIRILVGTASTFWSFYLTIFSTIKNPALAGFLCMVEGIGFEPMDPVLDLEFSKLLHSASSANLPFLLNRFHQRVRFIGLSNKYWIDTSSGQFISAEFRPPATNYVTSALVRVDIGYGFWNQNQHRIC